GRGGVGAVLRVGKVRGEEDFREGGGGVLGRGKQRDRRMHSLEGNQLVLLHPISEQRQSRRRDGERGPAPPTRFEVFRQTLVQPDGNAVVPPLQNHQVNERVRERDPPAIT